MNTVSPKVEKFTSSWRKKRGVGFFVCVHNASYAV